MMLELETISSCSQSCAEELMRVPFLLYVLKTDKDQQSESKLIVFLWHLRAVSLSPEWLKTNKIWKNVHGFDCSQQYTVISSATRQHFPRANIDTLQKTSVMLSYLAPLRLQICFNLFGDFTWVPLILFLACGNNSLTSLNQGFWGKPVKFGFKPLYRLVPNARRRFALRNITGQRLKLECPIKSLWLNLWSRVIIVNYN